MQKFKKEQNKKRTLFICLLLVLGVCVYVISRSYAKYEVIEDLKIIEGQVPHLSTKIVYYADDILTEDIPAKENNYAYVKTDCKKNKQAYWDMDSWSLIEDTLDSFEVWFYSDWNIFCF